MKPRTGSVWYSRRYKCYIAKLSATHPETKEIKEWKRHAETSREAHDKIKELQSLADQWLRREAPEGIDPHRMTFTDLANIFEKKKLVEAKYVHGHKISGHRALSGPRTWLADLIKYFGSKRLAAIKFSDLESFKTYLADRPARNGRRAIASINRELEFLRTVLNFAVSEGYLQRSPFHASKTRLIDRPMENKRERLLGFGEEFALTGQCQGKLEQLLTPLIVAVDTGLRQNEMLTLAVSDLDFVENVIRVRRENAKGNKPREISMTERVRSCLQQFCEGNDGLVFINLLDPRRKWVAPYSSSPRRPQQCYTLREIWEQAKRQAGIANLTWHDLRHAFVSRSILAGIPPAAVLKASGHSSEEWKRYLNMTPDQLRKLLAPLPGQGIDEVRLYAAKVMKGLRDALGYEEIERIFDLLKD